MGIGEPSQNEEETTNKRTQMATSTYSCHNSTSKGRVQQKNIVNDRPLSLCSQAVNLLAVWDQIRRTEEELMEIGTTDTALLEERSVGIDRFKRPREVVQRSAA
jgi:hypothetical protein